MYRSIQHVDDYNMSLSGVCMYIRVFCKSSNTASPICALRFELMCICSISSHILREDTKFQGLLMSSAINTMLCAKFCGVSANFNRCERVGSPSSCQILIREIGSTLVLERKKQQ